jgi:molybdenum cofactor biosynthesis protein B
VRVEPIRVHIAELVIAADPATADLSIADAISERAKAANVAVAARAIVGDDEAAIRAQLEAWIAQPDIDVVIATGPRESTAAASALKPLVTQPVPGFTDLFRWLAFQEIGAAAMHSNAEAAQCLSTFVFVLPASPQAVRDAMDKLILPQLDPHTKPKNLVTQIPRLAPLVAAVESVAVPEPVPGAKTEAVPTHVGLEKTEGGPGIPARMPARRSPTGQNILRKEPPADVTKQIDRELLERKLANDSPTRPNIDLRKLGLPRVPPGADDVPDDEVGDDTDLTAPAPPQPLARVKLVPQGPRAKKPPTLQIPPLPAKPGAEAKPARPRQDTDVTEPPTMETPKPASEPKRPSQPPAAATKQVGASAADAAARAADEAVTAAKRPSEPKVPEVVSLEALAKAAGEVLDNAPTKIKSIADVAAERAAKEARKEESRKAVAEMPDATRKGIGAVGETQKPSVEPSTAYVTSKPQVDEPPQRSSTAELSADDLREAIVEDGPTKKLPTVAEKPARTPRTRPPTAPPLPAKKRAPTDPPPVPVSAQPLPLVRRKPTEPPPVREADDLPRGKFVYPVKKSSAGKLLLFLVLAVAAAAGGILFVKFFIMKPDQPAQVANNPPPPPPVADAAMIAPALDAAVVAAVPVDAPEIEIEAPPPDAAVAPQHPNHPGRPNHPVVAHVPHDAGVAAAPAPDAAVVATGDPTCDEVSCVLEKYARPCCARWKPSDSGFKPKTGGLPEELDKSMVKSGVETVKPRVIACGEKGAAKGTVRVSLTVGPDGVVKDASVVEAPAPELGNCVASALRAARFDKSAKGGSFTYPFVF